MTTQKLVSMIIVNYNAGQYLHRCLTTVQEQTYPNWEVVVVDNNSSDASLSTAEGFPRTTIIRNDENRGFAAAQNQGMHYALGDYLMPLNFDIEMTPTFIEEMVAAMERSPNIGIVTAKLMQMHPNGRRSSRFYSTGHVLPPNRFAYHRGHGEEDRGQYDDPDQVFGAPGAAPLYRRRMLQDIAFRGQFFDETLFTWGEDVDLDWRANKLGWSCVYTPRAVAYHVGHPEGHGGDLWQIAVSIRNRWLVIVANEDSGLLGPGTWAILKYELSLVRYVLSKGYFPAYWKAVQGFLKLLPTTLEKRRWMKQRVVARRAGRDRRSH